MYQKIDGLARMLRLKQWIKNSFVLAPLFFSGRFLNLEAVEHAVWATVLFCIASSAVYVLNDIHDRERDRCHPKKSKTRPLAAGVITVPEASVLLVILYTCLTLACLFVPKLMFIVFAYIVLNVVYTFALKDQPVIDIFCIAIGFVLRVYAGAVAIHVPMSAWMFVTTLCLALYLAAIKRRQELSQNGIGGRKVLDQYSILLVDRYAEMSASAALMFYSMFVFAAKPQLIFTLPLVLFGVFRYWYVVERLDGGESPTDAVLGDKQVLCTIGLWIMACAWALWPCTE